MLDIEFQTQVLRLIDTFGKKSFPSERTKLIWGMVGDLDVSWFKYLVSQMIGDMRYAPLVKDFREAATKERGRGTNASQLKSLAGWADFEPAKRPECMLCGDDGLVDCWKLPERVYRKQFRCKCARASKYPTYAQWHRGLSEQYELDPWGEHTTPEQAATLKANWRLLLATI